MRGGEDRDQRGADGSLERPTKRYGTTTKVAVATNARRVRRSGFFPSRLALTIKA